MTDDLLTYSRKGFGNIRALRKRKAAGNKQKEVYNAKSAGTGKKQPGRVPGLSLTPKNM